MAVMRLGIWHWRDYFPCHN